MTAIAADPSVAVTDLDVAAYTVPTDLPEADGTLAWDKTTVVVVHAHAGGETGLGYTYADVSTARLVSSTLAGLVVGADALAPQAAWATLVAHVRNLGRAGVASMAISAVDCALWDLKARLLGVPLCTLLGAVREAVPVYGSGGFTSYTDAQLGRQLAGWVDQGIPRVKMKVGSEPERDPQRVRTARAAIGTNTALFVDANGAYTRTQAVALAQRFREEAAVCWFEEPVSSDDLAGLRFVRERAPAGIAIAAGEYGYDPGYFRRMLASEAVDVQQADVTRCGGITGLLRVDALCDAFGLPLSLHCGPSMHVHPALALGRLAHLEYFHDHVRIESLLFDGVAGLHAGNLIPDLGRSGNGLELRRADAERYAAA
jgi:L-alanine-DL-glutamate epimerase-like enolase superfamily enzyme